MTKDSSVRSGGVETRWYVERDEGIYVYEAEPLPALAPFPTFRGPDFATEKEAFQYALDCALDEWDRARRDANGFRRRLRTISKRKPALHKGNTDV